MNPSPSLNSGPLRKRIQAAEAAWERKDFPECIAQLESARRLAPANTDLILQLGRIHGLRYDYAAAERCFEQARRLAPGRTAMLAAIAEHGQGFRNPATAERYLRLAVEQPDATPALFVKLAELYERRRQLPEASELVERALALNPADPLARLTRARLERLAGRLEAAEQELRSALDRPMADAWIHAQSWYELATIRDRRGAYDEAMAAYLAAKQLLLPQAPRYLAELKHFRARLKVMETQVTSTLFQRWAATAAALNPPHNLTLLTGHVRSGTTLLEQVLDAHPEIVSAEETHVFLEEAFAPLKRRLPPDALMLPVLEAADPAALQQTRAAYFRAMELSLGQPLAGRRLLDKNPGYTYLIPAFLRVFPEARFLIALRDPRDVVLSCFLQAQALTPVTAAFLTLEGTAGDYAAVMSLWRTLAPLIPNPYLEVRYEDMVDDLESVARKTLDFLGAPWDATVLGFDDHARKKIVRSPTYADVTQPVYKRAMGRWRNYQKYLEPHLATLEPFVKAFGYE